MEEKHYNRFLFGAIGLLCGIHIFGIVILILLAFFYGISNSSDLLCIIIGPLLLVLIMIYIMWFLFYTRPIIIEYYNKQITIKYLLKKNISLKNTDIKEVIIVRNHSRSNILITYNNGEIILPSCSEEITNRVGKFMLDNKIQVEYSRY